MPELFDALGLPPGELLRTDGDFFMCVVDDAATVRTLAPDFAKLRALTDVRGVYVTAPGDAGYDIVSRCFAPRVGIDEDPVTGSMHCVLVAYWGPRLGRDELHAFQASARGGEVTVAAQGRPRAAHRPGRDRARRANYARERCHASCALHAVAQRHLGLPAEQLARAVDRAAVAERVARLARLLGRSSPARPRARRPASISSMSVISPPPATLQYVPGATSRSAASRLPRTMSST